MNYITFQSFLFAATLRKKDSSWKGAWEGAGGGSMLTASSKQVVSNEGEETKPTKSK